MRGVMVQTNNKSVDEYMCGFSEVVFRTDLSCGQLVIRKFEISSNRQFLIELDKCVTLLQNILKINSVITKITHSLMQ